MNYLTAAFALLSLTSFGQNTTQVNGNDVNATISDNGFFFTNSQSASPGYEVPAGSNNHAIYTGSFWFGGTDVNGQLKMAAQQFDGAGADFFAGAATRFSASLSDLALSADYFGQNIWTVTQDEIVDHIANFQSSTYTMPNDLENWPAHGDTSIGNSSGMLPFIAPFIDVNGNGQYDPANGDYPCIKGDVTVYTIMNDMNGLHNGSQGEPVGIELHCMFYQYNSITELENTTFMDIEVVNMDTQTLFDTKAGFFLDTDLGSFADDYIGTDTTRNMVYVYNSTDFDSTNFGIPVYGQAPPAVGIKILSHDISASMSYEFDSIYPYEPPSSTIQFYEAMNGNWQDGSDQLDNLGNPTNYAFYGDPNVVGSWSEYQMGNSTIDRRCVATLDAGVLNYDGSYAGTDRRTYSYAIIYARGTDHLNSVTELQTSADFVQNHYDNMMSNCFDLQVASLPELPVVEFSIVPNPNNGSFTIQLPSEGEATAEVKDAQGRIVHTMKLDSGVNAESIDLKSGVYFVTVSNENASGTKRMVIR